jgi:hypothetical protein
VAVERAAIEPGAVACTLILCGGSGHCCNQCQGSARLVDAPFRRIAGIDCLGNECERPLCGRLSASGFHALGSGDFELRGRVEKEHDSFVLEDVDLKPAGAASGALLR